MQRRCSFLLLSPLLGAVILMTQRWWETKPFKEWSASEVDWVLNSSPWVALNPLSTPRGSQQANPYPLNWRVSLLSAQPVREACLRRLSFLHDVQVKPDFEKTIRVQELGTRGEVEESQARLQRFIASNPTDVRVRGDDQHIVVGITVTQFMPPYTEAPGPSTRTRSGEQPGAYINWQAWREDPHPGFLMGKQLSDWGADTFLSTDRGKRVRVVRYDPPGLDLLGAKFYFPRSLPDGRPFVDNADKELRFESRIDAKAVKVKFDLKKTIYRGKREI